MEQQQILYFFGSKFYSIKFVTFFSFFVEPRIEEKTTDAVTGWRPDAQTDATEVDDVGVRPAGQEGPSCAQNS